MITTRLQIGDTESGLQVCSKFFSEHPSGCSFRLVQETFGIIIADNISATIFSGLFVVNCFMHLTQRNEVF